MDKLTHLQLPSETLYESNRFLYLALSLLQQHDEIFDYMFGYVELKAGFWLENIHKHSNL